MSHTRGERKGKFCDKAMKTPCGDCGQKKNYVDICKPKGWGDFTFPELVADSRKASGYRKQTTVFEAHHILCVDSILCEIMGKTGIQDVVRNTKWCVNNGGNMIALPLWGHTVMWYCEKSLPSIVFPTKLRAAPGFKNLPQHDWDHPNYKTEMEQDLADLANKFKDAAKAHTLTTKTIAGKLTALSATWKGKLKSRGIRITGTHEGWQRGSADCTSNWYLPFSMADPGQITKRGFPTVDKKWLKKLAAAIKAK